MHKKKKVVEGVIDGFKEKFSDMSSVSFSPMHNFLGIKMSFTDNSRVCIDMREYLGKAVSLYGKEGMKPVTILARNKLRIINRSSPILDNEKRKNFCSIVILLMYIAYRERKDIRPTVSFLSTRVSSPTEEDNEKLRRLIRYIVGSIDKLLYLGASNLSVLLNFIDVVYGVSNNMKSYTGEASTFRYGMFSFMLLKQKLNTTSLTTAELVGVANYLLKVSYFRNFLEAQGVEVKRNIILQVNQSVILMEKNRRRWCSKRTQYLDMRYFYVKDVVE